jgi:hypothetical protein
LLRGEDIGSINKVKNKKEEKTNTSIEDNNVSCPVSKGTPISNKEDIEEPFNIINEAIILPRVIYDSTKDNRK